MAKEATNTTITFRLSDELHDEVVRRAVAGGISKHEVARKIVVSSLLGSGKDDDAELDVDGVQEAFESLHDSVLDLRKALGRGIAAILQDVAPHRNKEEIRKWVSDRIITPSIQKSQPTPEGDDPP